MTTRRHAAWLLHLGRCCLAACMALGMPLLAQAAGAIALTDDRGHVLRLAQPPQRIVSLLPSLTESVCALGECGRLVGVDRYSNWPAEVDQLPKVGGGLDPVVEAIIALRPDVVLISTSSRAGARLEALGIPVAAFEPRTYADTRRVLESVARVLGVEPASAARLWREIESGVQAAAQSPPARVKGTRVYFEVSRGPYAAGEASVIGETLARLGVRNVVPRALGPYPRLNPEFVVRADPDVIMVGNRSMQAMVPYPGWQGMRALAQQRVCVFGPGDADVVVRPGPRLAEAARIMANCLAEKAP